MKTWSDVFAHIAEFKAKPNPPTDECRSSIGKFAARSKERPLPVPDEVRGNNETKPGAIAMRWQDTMIEFAANGYTVFASGHQMLPIPGTWEKALASFYKALDEREITERKS